MLLLKTATLISWVPAVLARIELLGAALTGVESGCQTDGTCSLSSVKIAHDAADQMIHLVQHGMNIFRLPTSWQFLVNDRLGADLDKTNFAEYDKLVQSCLDTGAYCVIDIGNFARWNGKTIGQGGPSDKQFATLWARLAKKYAAEEKTVFALVNSPHDVDADLWAQTCQSAVTCIREAGAKSQIILLPGINLDAPATLLANDSTPALMQIKNPDGSSDNLLLDIHKYVEKTDSTGQKCLTANTDVYVAMTTLLRKNGRQGLVRERDASVTTSCLEASCAQNSFINDNPDVFRGFIAWSASSFSVPYVVGTATTPQNGQVDTQLVSQCAITPQELSEELSDYSRGSPSSTSSPTATTLITAPGTVKPAPVPIPAPERPPGRVEDSPLPSSPIRSSTPALPTSTPRGGGSRTAGSRLLILSGLAACYVWHAQSSWK